jgi:Domain of unknown function (DUF4349)
VSQLELVQELRAARPVAPEALRERVRALAPPPPRRFELNFRRLVPAGAGVALAGALAVAVVAGVLHSGPKASTKLEAQPAPKETRTQTPHGAAARNQSLSKRLPAYSAALAPTAGRLQQYDAFMRVRVDSQDELSRSTQDVLRFTRHLGGYLVWARYGAPGKRGDSELSLRVPIGRVQAAIARFAGYGSLLSQRIVLKDLQKRADELAVRIQAVEADLAAAVRQGQLQRANADRARLATLRAQRANTLHRGHFARIALTMVAKPKPAAAAGRFDRTMDEAGSVLAREFEILLYALIVAGPLLLLGGLAILAARAQRRRADRRLLERT